MADLIVIKKIDFKILIIFPKKSSNSA